MNLWRYIFVPLVGLTFILPACGFFNSKEKRDVLTIGTRHITLDELKKDIQRLSVEMNGTGQTKTVPQSELWLNQIIDHYLILEYGQENGISITDEEVEEAVDKIKKDIPPEDFKNILLQGYINFSEWKETFKNQLLVNKIIKKVLGDITLEHYDEIKKYYETHLEEFKHLPMVKFRQIVTRTKTQAEELRQKIEQGADMAMLAKEYSITPEAKNGGEVGWLEKGTLEESLEQTIFSLTVGKTSPVINSPYGFHIIKLLAIRTEGVKSLPEVRKEIESNLLYQKREVFYNDWLSQLHRKYPVKINYEILKTLELNP
jgi:parvulin-like peptidyl-prolyl isomerase